MKSYNDELKMQKNTKECGISFATVFLKWVSFIKTACKIVDLKAARKKKLLKDLCVEVVYLLVKWCSRTNCFLWGFFDIICQCNKFSAKFLTAVKFNGHSQKKR